MGTTGTSKLEKIAASIEGALWHHDLDQISRFKRQWYRFLRTLDLGVRGFVDQQCLLRASALTYTTLLSLVPLLALMFSILKGLGVQRRLEPVLLEKVSAGSEKVVTQIVQYIDKTNVNTLGALGLAGLIVTAISVMGNVELAFNGIWGVKKTRSLRRKFSDYLSVLLTCPLLVLVALAVTSSIESMALARQISRIPGVSHFMLLLAFLSPYLLIWAALTFVYSYLPNTEVRLRSAVFGAVIAGTLLQVGQWGYVHFQVGAARYNAIYGAFAQLPIFLGWLYLGWVIVLFGGVISFVYQNPEARPVDRVQGEVPYSLREEVSLKLLVLIARNFYAEAQHWTAGALSEELGVPNGLVGEILDRHCQSGILIRAPKDGKEIYLLAKPPERLILDEIIERMRNYGQRTMKAKTIGGEDLLRKTLDQAEESRRTILSNRTLKDFVD